MTWRTPIRPLEFPDMWCVWDWGGVYEWMVHPEMARNLLRTGIKVDGVWCQVVKIDEWPHINAWQIRAILPEALRDGYTRTVSGRLVEAIA